MIKRPALLLSIIIIIGITVILIYRTQTNPFQNTQSMEKQENINVRISSEIVDLYAENCAVCHGEAGQGLTGYPSIQTSQLDVDEIKVLISSGQGVMPAFPHIQEPQLTQLAEMVKKFSDQ